MHSGYGIVYIAATAYRHMYQQIDDQLGTDKSPTLKHNPMFELATSETHSVFISSEKKVRKEL
jgi:hypothetical protein